VGGLKDARPICTGRGRVVRPICTEPGQGEGGVPKTHLGARHDELALRVAVGNGCDLGTRPSRGQARLTRRRRLDEDARRPRVWEARRVTTTTAHPHFQRQRQQTKDERARAREALPPRLSRARLGTHLALREARGHPERERAPSAPELEDLLPVNELGTRLDLGRARGVLRRARGVLRRARGVRYNRGSAAGGGTGGAECAAAATRVRVRPPALVRAGSRSRMGAAAAGMQRREG